MITRVEAALLGLTFGQDVKPVTLMTGENQSGKSTRLGVADLVIRGGAAGVYPVLGRPKGPWSASITLDGRVFTRAGRDGTASGCKIDGVKVAVRDFDAVIQGKAGAAGVWRLNDFAAATPTARLNWLVSTLFEGADTSELAVALEGALSGLGELRAALQIGAAPWTPAAVQDLRRTLADELTRRGLTPDLAPRGPRFKDVALPEAPSGRAVGHALADVLATVLKLAAQLRRADVKQAEAEADRLAQRIASRGELPAGTVASNRSAAEALQVEINQALEQRQRDYSDIKRREALEEGVVEANDALQRARAATARSAVDVRAALESAQREHSTALREVEDAVAALSGLDAEVASARERVTLATSADTQAAVAASSRREVQRIGAEVGELLGATETALADLRALVEGGRLRATVLERASMVGLISAAETVRARIGQPQPEVSGEAQGPSESDRARATLATITGRRDAKAREVSALTTAQAAKRGTMDALGRELQELDRTSTAQRAAVTACEERLRLAQSALNGLPVVGGLDLIDALIDSKQADRRRLIEAADKLSDVEGDRVALESARADAQRLQAELDTVIATRDAITAAKSQWLASKISGSLAPARRITTAVLGAEVSVTTDDDGAHILLGDIDLDTVQGDQLRSPRIVALAALRVAMLSNLEGLRALFVDDLECIDEERRSRFIEALAAEVRCGTIHQVMGASVDALVTPLGDDVCAVRLTRS